MTAVKREPGPAGRLDRQDGRVSMPFAAGIGAESVMTFSVDWLVTVAIASFGRRSRKGWDRSFVDETLFDVSKDVIRAGAGSVGGRHETIWTNPDNRARTLQTHR